MGKWGEKEEIGGRRGMGEKGEELEGEKKGRRE